MLTKSKIKIVRAVLLVVILFSGAFVFANTARAIAVPNDQDSANADCPPPSTDCPIQKEIPVVQDTTPTATTPQGNSNPGNAAQGNSNPASSAPSGSSATNTNSTTASTSTDPCTFNNQGNQICNPLKVSDLKAFIIKLIKYVLGVIALIAVMAIVYAGFLLVASAGNEKVYANARRVIIYAISGLALSAIAYSIIAIVDSVLK